MEKLLANINYQIQVTIMRRFLRFRSELLIVLGILFAFLPVAAVSAGPLDSIPDDPKATTLIRKRLSGSGKWGRRIQYLYHRPTFFL